MRWTSDSLVTAAEATKRQVPAEGPERRTLLYLVLHFGRQQAAVETDEIVPACTLR